MPNRCSVSATDAAKVGLFQSTHRDQNPAVSMPDLVQFSRGGMPGHIAGLALGVLVFSVVRVALGAKVHIGGAAIAMVHKGRVLFVIPLGAGQVHAHFILALPSFSLIKFD